LLAAILSLLPLGLTPVSSFTQVAPLVVVLVVTGIKDAIEDIVSFLSSHCHLHLASWHQLTLFKKWFYRPGIALTFAPIMASSRC